MNGDELVTEATEGEDKALTLLFDAEGMGDDVDKPVVVALVGVTAMLFKLIVVTGA